MNQPEQEIVEQKVRRAAAINALRKIGRIVARENQADMDRVKVLRWFVRYGWMILLGGALLLAYGIGII
ncbi:MAG: hypothetical protein ACOY9D_04115 [Pseudomonadota bacterium]